MTDKELKKAPETMPTDTRELYEFLANSDPYEGESESDFQSRKNLAADFKMKLTAAGMDLDDLVAAKMGIPLQKKTAVSPLMQKLVGRI